MQGAGYLAIWSDLAPQDETDWAHWITREHAAERVGINGFLACRIFRALGVVGEPLFHSLRTRGRTRRRRSGLSGAAERADAMVATASCPGSAISHAAAAASQLQPAPARAASSLPCASTPRRPGTPPRLPPSSRASTASSPRGVLLTDIAQTSIKTREKGMRSQRRLLRRPAADRGPGRGRGPRRPPSSAQDASRRGSRRDRDLPLYRLAFSLPKQLLPG